MRKDCATTLVLLMIIGFACSSNCCKPAIAANEDEYDRLATLIEQALLAADAGDKGKLNNTLDQINSLPKPGLAQGDRTRSNNLNIRGEVAFKSEQLNDAYDAFRAANAADPTNVAAAVNLAQVETLIGKLQDSLEQVKTTIALNPRESAVWDILGTDFILVQDRERAVASWLVEYELSRDKASNTRRWQTLTGSESAQVSGVAKELLARTQSSQKPYNPYVPHFTRYRVTTALSNRARQLLGTTPFLGYTPFYPTLSHYGAAPPNLQVNRLITDGSNYLGDGRTRRNEDLPQDRSAYLNFLYHLHLADASTATAGNAIPANVPRLPESSGGNPFQSPAQNQAQNPMRPGLPMPNMRQPQRSSAFKISLAELYHNLNVRAKQTSAGFQMQIAKPTAQGFYAEISDEIALGGDIKQPSGTITLLQVTARGRNGAAPQSAERKKFMAVIRCLVKVIDPSVVDADEHGLLMRLGFNGNNTDAFDKTPDFNMQAQLDGFNYQAYTGNDGDLNLVIVPAS